MKEISSNQNILARASCKGLSTATKVNEYWRNTTTYIENPITSGELVISYYLQADPG